MLLEKGVSGEIKEDIELINKEAGHAANIVKMLLTFVSCNGTEKSQTDINCIIQDVLQDVLIVSSYEHRLHNIKVETQFTSALPVVIVNGPQMQ